MTETVSDLEARYDRAIKNLEDALYERIRARLARKGPSRPSAPAAPAPAPAMKRAAPARAVQYRTPNPGRTFRQEPSAAAQQEEQARLRRLLRVAFYLAAFVTAVATSIAIIYVPEANKLGWEVMDWLSVLVRIALSYFTQ